VTLCTRANGAVEERGTRCAVWEELAGYKVCPGEAGEVAALESAAYPLLDPATLYDALQEERLRIATHE
jgi:hypothetical protein